MKERMKERAIPQPSHKVKVYKVIPRAEVNALNNSARGIYLQNEKERKDAMKVIGKDTSIYKEKVKIKKVTRTL